MTLTGRTAFLVVAGLVVSVCVNAFALGILGGRWYRDHESFLPRLAGAEERGRGGPPLAYGLERFTDDAPPEARAVLREALAERRREVGDRLRAVGEARRALVASVRAEPFDRGRLDAALADLRDRSTDVQVVIHAGVADAVARMPQPVRAVWAEGLMRRPGGREGREPREERERRGDR
jgi:uncharacterized membrane protein